MKKLLLATTAFVLAANIAAAQTANVSTTEVTISGASLTLPNAQGTTYFKNDGKTVLAVQNHGATPISVTLVTQKTTLAREGYSTATLSNETVSVPAESSKLIGPFPTAQWNTTAGTVRVSFSEVTEVSASAFKVR